jgi:murein DD-endopeptidase MepM/ murein hydrolase activator NlpD
VALATGSKPAMAGSKRHSTLLPAGLAVSLVLLQPAGFSQPLPVRVDVQTEAGAAKLTVTNETATPVQVTFDDLKGRVGVATVPANASEVHLLAAGTAGVRWSARPVTVSPIFLAYELPFVGPARVTQLPDCTTTHTGPLRHAVDFAMPEGTPIRAARDGTVLESGPSVLKGVEEGVQLQVLHTDGSWAIYGHLKEGASLVSPGQFVQAGDLLAYSGNTGTSTGPHLHFAVYYMRNGRPDSLPIGFKQAVYCGQILVGM